MGPRSVVLIEILGQCPSEMPGAQNHKIVQFQALSSYRADQSFGVWILPGTLGLGEDFFDPKRRDPQTNVMAVDAVVISDQVVRQISIGKASTICREVQAKVGCSVTWKCSTSRRRCSNTRNTNSTFMVAVGTVKKSMDTIGSTWL